MSHNIKQELIERISATNDVSLLLLLKNDLDYFSSETIADVTDELSAEDKAELIELVQEPFGKETISQQDFDEAVMKWRTK